MKIKVYTAIMAASFLSTHAYAAVAYIPNLPANPCETTEDIVNDSIYMRCKNGNAVGDWKCKKRENGVIRNNHYSVADDNCPKPEKNKKDKITFPEILDLSGLVYYQ